MKQSKHNKKTNNQWIIFAVPVIAIVAIALAIVVSSTTRVAERINPTEYQDQFDSTPHLLLDVRTPEEFVSGHIPGAVNISLQTLENRLSEIPYNQPIVVYCRSGNRSASASDILIDAGYTDVYDLGGILDWQSQSLPIE